MDESSNDDPIRFVTCPDCGKEAPDFGANVKCEYCKSSPMPYYDDNGNLVEG